MCPPVPGLLQMPDRTSPRCSAVQSSSRPQLIHARAAIAAHERLAEDDWTPLERSRIDRQIAEALERLGRRQNAGPASRPNELMNRGRSQIYRICARQVRHRYAQPSAQADLAHWARISGND
jgi:hypothetical protein